MSESRDVREDGAEHGLALLITDLDRGVSIVEVNEDGNKDPADRRSDHGGAWKVNGVWRTLGRSRFARSIAPACDGLISVSEVHGWGMEAYHGVWSVLE